MINEVNHAGNKHVSLAESNTCQQLMAFLSKIQPGDLLKGQLVMDQEGKTFLRLENGMMLDAKCLQSTTTDRPQTFEVVLKGRWHLEIMPKHELMSTSKEGKHFFDQEIAAWGLKNNNTAKTVVSHLMEKQLPLIKHQIVQLTQMTRYLPAEALVNVLSKGSALKLQELEMLADYQKSMPAKVERLLQEVLESVPATEKEKLIEVIGKTVGTKETIPSLIQLEKAAQGEGQSKEGMDFFKLPKTVTMEKVKAYLRAAIGEALTVQVSSKDQKMQARKLSETGILLKKLSSELKETGLQGIDEAKLYEIEQLGEVIEKYRAEGQYYAFPFRIDEKEAKGKLYFFAPKKREKQGHQGMYIVLALEMPALQKIEIHVKDRPEGVAITLNVENEKIKGLMEKHKQALEEALGNIDFKVSYLSCQLMNEQPKEMAGLTYETLTHLDTRI